MISDIFVGVMIVVAIGAGIWCWWFENIGPKQEDAETKQGGKKK